MLQSLITLLQLMADGQNGVRGLVAQRRVDLELINDIEPVTIQYRLIMANLARLMALRTLHHARILIVRVSKVFVFEYQNKII